MKAPRVPLRWTPDGPELQCRHCREWWLLTSDNWKTWENRWDRCMACIREHDRMAKALKGLDPDYRARMAERQRRYRAWLKREAPDLVAAFQRERAAERRRERRAAA